MDTDFISVVEDLFTEGADDLTLLNRKRTLVDVFFT